jgi:hypothetical protein
MMERMSNAQEWKDARNVGCNRYRFVFKGLPAYILLIHQLNRRSEVAFSQDHTVYHDPQSKAHEYRDLLFVCWISLSSRGLP